MMFLNSSHASLPSFFPRSLQNCLSQKVIGDGEQGLVGSALNKCSHLHLTRISKLLIMLLDSRDKKTKAKKV